MFNISSTIYDQGIYLRNDLYFISAALGTLTSTSLFSSLSMNYACRVVNVKVFYMLLYSIALRTLSLSSLDLYLNTVKSLTVTTRLLSTSVLIEKRAGEIVQPIKYSKWKILELFYVFVCFCCL